MKNKLTLKILKEELERLKKSKGSSNSESIRKSDTGGLHGIKNSYINNLYSKSGALWLYIITGILGYAHKIPFIGKILSLLSLWYGRITIWKILVKIRKAFVIFNAIIGVYIVFKTTGFNTDNILAGFYGVGHTYVEALFSLTKRLFNWFVELFDHKIVPNVTNTPKPSFPNHPLWSGGWYHKPIQNTPLSERILDLGNLNKNLFSDPFNVNINIPSTPWYKDSTSWLWILGITCTLGLVVLGYKMIQDPTILQSLTGCLASGKRQGDVANPGPSTNPNINIQDAEGGVDPDITLKDSRSSRALGKAKEIVVGFINLPGFEYFKDITLQEYIKLNKDYLNIEWNFKDEAIKYCKLDCESLYEVLIKFNELFFNKWNINIHDSLTLPSLVFKLFKTHYMPNNTIYQLHSLIEQNIRLSYTGCLASGKRQGAVDVYIPHNRNDNLNYQQLFLYDVNSLYPFVMANNHMPIGNPTVFEGNIRNINPNAFGLQ